MMKRMYNVMCHIDSFWNIYGVVVPAESKEEAEVWARKMVESLGRKVICIGTVYENHIASQEEIEAFELCKKRYNIV